MKLYLLVLVGLCAYAQAAVVQDEIVEVPETHVGPKEFNLKAAGANSDVTEDDQLLATELSELEKSQSRNLIADSIKDLLEGVRPIIVNGDETNGLPPLDPLVIPEIGPIEHSQAGIRITATIQNFRGEGLKWYVVDHVTFNTLRLALGVKVTVPWLIFTGSYDARAIIILLTHNAGGDYRVFVNRLEVYVDARLGINILGGGHLTLRELDINIVFHDITVRLDGMVGSSILNNLINSAVQSAAQDLFQNQLADISKALSESLFDTINELLKSYTLDDLLG